MNPRNEQLLIEVQQLRKQAHEDAIRIKMLSWLALSGWVLVVGLMCMVPV